MYLHDSPSKHLFGLEKRDFSHGYNRVSEPIKLAPHLPWEDSAWTPQRVDAAMASGDK